MVVLNYSVCKLSMYLRVCSRVDHLYAFFVQWSPDVYGKEAREQGFVVVEKDELDMIDNFFSDPASCSWEVSSVVASLYLQNKHCNGVFVDFSSIVRNKTMFLHFGLRPLTF